MKHVSFLFASLLLLLPQSAFAQPQTAEPEPEVSDEPEPEVSDEPEPEVSEPEPEVSDEGENEEGETEGPGEITGPEVVHEPESGADLGAAGTVTTPTQSALAGAAVEDAAEDVQEAEAAEEGQPAEGARRRRGAVGPDGEPLEEQDTADRLAQANPNSGLPWALPINFSQQFTVGLYADEYDFTPNPTYAWAFSMVPRYNLDNGLSIGLRIPLSIEWTDSDFAAGERYLWWGDLQADATYTLPWKPGGTMIIPSFLLSAGTSPISRGARRYVGPGGRLLFIKPIPILGGLILGGGASYTYWAGDQNEGVTPRGRVRGDNQSWECQRSLQDGFSRSAPCDVVPGTNTPIRHVLSAGLFGTLIPASGWQINLSFTAIWNKGDGVGEDCVETETGIVCLGDNSDNDHWRQLTSFGFSFGYDVTSYMTMTLGYSTLAFHPDSEGGAESMFFNENTQVNLGLQFRVDGMVVALRAMADEAEEGDGEEAAAEGLRRTAF